MALRTDVKTYELDSDVKELGLWNEMVALLNGLEANLGAGVKIRRGQHTTVAAADTIATGLTTVVAVLATLESDPVIGADSVSAQVGNQAGAPAAGSVIIKTWKPTATGDVTPVAATTFGRLVNWIAIGT